MMGCWFFGRSNPQRSAPGDGCTRSYYLSCEESFAGKPRNFCHFSDSTHFPYKLHIIIPGKHQEFPWRQILWCSSTAHGCGQGSSTWCSCWLIGLKIAEISIGKVCTRICIRWWAPLLKPSFQNSDASWWSIWCCCLDRIEREPTCARRTPPPPTWSPPFCFVLLKFLPWFSLLPCFTSTHNFLSC